MSNVRPILKFVPLRPLARWMAVTVVLYLRERAQRVSPFLMVWRMGALRAGLALTAGLGFGRLLLATDGLVGRLGVLVVVGGGVVSDTNGGSRGAVTSAMPVG